MQNQEQTSHEVKKRIITITGMPGSGKSSTSKLVAASLGFSRFSSGDFMRDIAAQRVVSIDELNTMMEREPALDREVDAVVRSKGTEHDIVLDSRLAWHWIPSSFKVFLRLDPKTAAERIFKQIQQEGRLSEEFKTEEEVVSSISNRLASEKTRYQELYGVNYLDESHYDLVVDTSRHTLPDAAHTIETAYQKWIADTATA